MEKAGQTILVTGASSGIGAAIATRLVADGHRVFGTSRKSSFASNGVHMLDLDVASDASVNACVRAVLAEAGHLDVLINNAGFLLACAIEEATIEEAKAQFETNFFGVARMVRAVLPSMRARKAGKIVNVSSLAGMVPVPFWGYYNASKFALEGYTETLRLELKPLGIRVAMVEPGAIKTPFYGADPMGRMPEYSPWRERALKTMKGFEDKAPGPDVVADLVARIVAQANPSLRNTVTREATLFPFLRWLLPAGAFEAGLRSGFNLDKEGF
jgi:NAD(P)-dependent dehydrogenase (short-subunit alcohol dehydrogenase family)